MTGISSSSHSTADRMSVAVLQKVQDQTKTEGRAIVTMIEAVGEVMQGPQEEGRGQSVDVRA